MRKIKTIGLAAVAAMALTSFVGVASAAATVDVGVNPFGFAADSYTSYPLKLSGNSYTQYGNPPHTFTFTAIPSEKVVCQGVDLHTISNLTAQTDSIGLHAGYDNCTSFQGTVPVVINTNSCHYVFHYAGYQTPPWYYGQLDVACDTSGDTIDLNYLNTDGSVACTKHILEQDDVGTLQFENFPLGYGFSHKSIGVDIETQGLQYTNEKVICGPNKGVKTDGGYSGATVLEGYAQ